MKKFEVDVHNRILDQVVQSLYRRFATQKKLYADLSYFDPKRFSETILHGIPILAVNMICNLSWAYDLKAIWGGTKFLPEKFVTAIKVIARFAAPYPLLLA